GDGVVGRVAWVPGHRVAEFAWVENDRVRGDGVVVNVRGRRGRITGGLGPIRAVHRGPAGGLAGEVGRLLISKDPRCPDHDAQQEQKQRGEDDGVFHSGGRGTLVLVRREAHGRTPNSGTAGPGTRAPCGR